jgi:hypothetical protein
MDVTVKVTDFGVEEARGFSVLLATTVGRRLF